jgi:glutamyl endopeptidase
MRTAAKARGAGGGSAPESKIGAKDGRVQISPTTTFPARATVEILFKETSTGPTYLCTGFFVGPDTVVTAGHCVHKGTGGAAGFFVTNSYQLRPGRNGATVPYTCPRGVVAGARRLWTNTGWANGGGEARDYGAIHTTCALGETVGWYGYSNTQSLASLTNLSIHTRGYPGDKPSGTQWLSNNCTESTTFVQCKVAATGSRQIFYANDTFGGQSGSPVYRTSAPSVGGCAGTCVYAIHAYGAHSGVSQHTTFNHGTRIGTNLYGFINFVRNGGVTTHN